MSAQVVLITGGLTGIGRNALVKEREQCCRSVALETVKSGIRVNAEDCSAPADG
jgi:NAD(P)-dependent dehydrogenase (short-subunit alcohol dehydrogenase family)